jgi:hypothetical protein
VLLDLLLDDATRWRDGMREWAHHVSSQRSEHEHEVADGVE